MWDVSTEFGGGPRVQFARAVRYGGAALWSLIVAVIALLGGDDTPTDRSDLTADDPDFEEMWTASIAALNRHLAIETGTGFYYTHVDMHTGEVTTPVFGALDAFTREDLWQTMHALRAEEPFTGVLITHDLIEIITLHSVNHN